MADREVTLELPGVVAPSRNGSVPSDDGEGEGDDELAHGARVGEYAIVKLIARGGHGAVYLAEHRVLGRRAAIKILHRRLADSAEMVGRFVREAQVVNRVAHPNIVDIYDLGTLQDGRPFCVMELLPGRSLRDLIRARGRLSPAEALAYLEPACAALQAAHEAGVVHRDVKSANIAVLSEGDRPAIKLLDFGVAKSNAPGQAGLTTDGERLGTSQVMAPEQIVGGSVDPRTDVYALGVLLFELVTGMLPFRSDDPMEIERQHLEDPPPRPSQHAPVAPALDAVVACCMAKRPDKRFGSVGAFLSAFRQAVGPAEPGNRAYRPAIAIHVSVRTEPLCSDAALMAAAQALDAAEKAVTACGFSVPLRTSVSLLAGKLLAEDARQAVADRGDAVELARSLSELAQADGDLDVPLEVSIHAAPALVREGAGGPELVGGPLFQTESWVAEGEPFHATAEALAGTGG
jgi:serine/threonine-protein kinase